MPEQTISPQRTTRWFGMHTNERTPLRPGEVLLAENFYVDDGVFVPRPGTDILGGQLASGSAIQGIVYFEELDGTVHILAFAGGDMHEYDEGTDSWSTTDLAGEGLTVASNQKLSFANSRGRLIVTDGVNQPWMWDGDTTFTSLTDAPVARGVEVYYDRVFFYDIPADTISFEWSDPADPTAGYSAKGQDWQFAQTDAGRIRGLAPLNNRLVVFKEDSSTFVLGAVESSFETAAVREGLSETEGSVARQGVVILDGNIFFLSQQGPRVALGGQRIERINENDQADDRLKDLWDDVDRSRWEEAMAVVDTNERQVIWHLPGDSYSLVYNVNTDSWAKWTFPYTVEALGEVEFVSGDEYILVGDDQGYVHRLDPPSKPHSDEVTPGVTQGISKTIRSRLFGKDYPNTLQRIVEVRIVFDMTTDLGFKLGSYIDGDTTFGPEAGVSQKRGPTQYRRGMNVVAIAPGWEFSHDAEGEYPVLQEATTLMTMVGSYDNF